MRTLILLTSLALPVVVPSMAQQPQVQNGQVSTSTSSLTSAIDALKGKDTVGWVAYTIPTSHRIQNGWNPDGVSYLENENRHDDSDDRNDSRKETYRALLLIRVANHAMERIRVEDPDRKLDAGGVRVEFLPNVEPEKSIAVLQQLAESATTNKVRDGAVFAISLHQSPATVPALTALGSAGHDLQVREKAAFWLVAQYKKQALPILDRWIKSDSDDRFREKLTFNLSM
ncbi:MAG: HEAT repeat domain-containing protein, partial [Terriglobus sp.]